MTLKTLSASIWFFVLAASTAGAEPPNFVVLYADDAGYADFGFQPSVREEMKHLTPNIDSLARDGARFSQFYMTADTCSPSRAGIMTGRYQQRFGHDHNLPPGCPKGLPRTETFGADRLHALGYETALVGKWHLGYPKAYQPNPRGFDWFYGLLQGSRPYYPQDKISADRAIQVNGRRTPETGYVTDRLGDAACRFIKEHQNDPFFLFVSFTAPHGPLQPRKSDAARIAHIKEGQRRDYAGLVVALDDNVGKILAALKEAGLDDKTLVVFTNDNGGSLKNGANNSPLRGGKGSWWEGGFRVPMAMRWPGKIPPGSVLADPVISLDLLPTFIAAAGGVVQPEWNLDGVNLVPAITVQQDRLPERTLYWRRWNGGSPVTVIREGRWRLVYGKDPARQAPALYDIEADVGETRNLAAQYPDRVRAMRAKGEAWQKDFPGPLWRRSGAKGEETDDGDEVAGAGDTQVHH